MRLTPLVLCAINGDVTRLGAVPFPAVAPELARAQENAAVDLVPIHPVADELAARFAAAGHRLYLVGGSVRDALVRPNLDNEQTI